MEKREEAIERAKAKKMGGKKLHVADYGKLREAMWADREGKMKEVRSHTSGIKKFSGLAERK